MAALEKQQTQDETCLYEEYGRKQQKRVISIPDLSGGNGKHIQPQTAVARALKDAALRTSCALLVSDTSGGRESVLGS